MTRREQILANGKSLARLHVLECNQLSCIKSTLFTRRNKMTKKEQILANRKSLARLHVLEFHQLIMLVKSSNFVRGPKFRHLSIKFLRSNARVI